MNQMTREQKLAVVERLRHERRWPQASEFKESERRRLREAGVARREALDAAWAAMVKRFPPVENANGDANHLDSPDASVDPDDFKAAFEALENSRVSLSDQVQWVFHQLANPNPEIKDAITPGAFELLRYVQAGGRRARENFYSVFLSKLMPTRGEIDNLQRLGDDRSIALKRLDEFRARVRKESENGQIYR